MSTARQVAAAARVRGSLCVPGDKSTSHRALIISALAAGRSAVRGLSPGEDVRATAAIVGRLGAEVTANGAEVIVTGRAGGLRASDAELDCANSGTSMRLLAGVVSAVVGTHTLVGDASLSRRPMDRVAAPLAIMGATVSGHGEHCHAPLTVVGSRELRGVEYDVPVPSAQVKSAVLLAGLSAGGHTVVTEAVRTRSTTEDMLVHAGVALHSVDEGPGRRVTLTPGRPQPREWDVPGDPSQAAFFVVLGLVHPDAEVMVRDVDGSRERVGFVGVLERMGANLHVDGADGALTLAAASSHLVAAEVAASEIPSVDEVPALVVAAAAASGVSVFRDVGELRLKESDRFGACLDLARAVGATAWDEGDDLYVQGLGSADAFSPFTFDARLDHRLVMASAVAMTAGAGGSIVGARTVASSYPGFFDDLAALS